MTGDLNIQTTARDLVLNLNDSCNCCCWKGKKHSPKTHVYVRHTGEVEVFDSSKAQNTREAMTRCISNLGKIIDNMEEDEVEAGQKEALMLLKKRVIKNDESPPSPITLGIIEDVLRIRNRMKPVMKMI